MNSHSNPYKKRFCSDLSIDNLQDIATHFQGYLTMYRPYFRTATGNMTCHAHAYLAGLMMKAPRKNIERMEEYVAGSNYESMQQFITDSPWDDQALQHRQAKDVSDQIGGVDSALVVDESAFAKKGDKSVGVKRQWSGRLGKTEKCQVGVFSSLVLGTHGAIIGKRLYLPHDWVADEARCIQAGIPEASRVFKTKIELAIELVDEAIASGVVFGYVCGDGFYGHTPEFLRALDTRKLTFMMDVHKNQHVYFEDPKPYLPRRIDNLVLESRVRKTKVPALSAETIAAGISAKDWEMCTIRETTKGTLSVKVWRKQVWLWDGKEKHAHKWWLVITRNVKDNETKIFVSNAPETESIESIARKHAQRFWIERCFQDAKTSVGMADYQARKWNSWHHHMCMVSMAMLFVLKVKVASQYEKSKDCPLSYNDIVEMLNFYLPREDTTPEALLKTIIKRHKKRWESEQSAYRKQWEDDGGEI